MADTYIVGEVIRLPGLVDMHVHFRTPGQEYKEDFTTGTSAALAGGIVNVFDMPNNQPYPITTVERLTEKIDLATQQAVTDVGFYFGSLNDNIGEFQRASELAFGLKLYLNPTTGDYKIDVEALTEIYKEWHAAAPNKIILLHAEEDVVGAAMELVRRTRHPTHVAHVSNRNELQAVMDAKREGLPVTCGVCPHHLFLTDADSARLGAYGHMKPPLKSQADQDFLWGNLSAIDVFETDHAPHTVEEKESDNPPPGVPGVETLLPLLLEAERDGKISLDEIIKKTAIRPREILGLPLTDSSMVTVVPEEYEVERSKLHTRAGWSPFEGRLVFGRVASVQHRGREVYRDGEVLAQPGEGQVLRPAA
jgi:dihydroorotase-like cyclic amidohydrolase